MAKEKLARKKFKVNSPKLGSHKYDLTGKKFGMLTVESFDHLDNWKNKKWLCKCDCGNYCKVTTTYLNSGKTTSCKCNQYKKGDKVYNYTGYKEITGTKWNSIKNNALNRNLEFNISKEFIWSLFLKQNKKCSFTDISISYKDGTASIDRIDNDKGYNKDNVTIVHKDINLMRNKLNVEYFIKMCELVTINSKTKKDV